MGAGNDNITIRNRKLAGRPIVSTQIADNLNIPNDQWITASVWGYDSKSHFESGSNANLTVYSAYSSHNEYFNGNRSETLTANSAWSQVNGGVPFGSSYGNLAAVRHYSGGSSDVWNGYGGFASTYCGTESQTWNDPSIASYDARNLTGTRFTPHDPPGVPAPYSFNTPNMKFVMPPALVEDTEAVAVEEGEESSIGDFLWGLVPGHSLLDAYRDYQKGDYVSAGLNGVSGLSDLLSLGAITKAKSSLKFFVGVMKVRIKDSVVDAVANEAGNAVAERLGPEAGFVTRMIVSAKLSKDVSQQNKPQLGFAIDDGSKNKLSKELRNKLKRINNEITAGGNRGISGTVTRDEAMVLGTRFVGSGYKRMSNNKGLISEDGLRQFRFPVKKSGINRMTGKPWSRIGFVANFESRLVTSSAWLNNVHLDVEP